VSLAVAVSRHSALSWDDAALPDDFEAIGRLLGLTPGQARERVMRVAAQAAERENWYGLIPPGARVGCGHMPPEPRQAHTTA
jgi:hypothetical protein